LESQHKTILNVDEVKKAYLQNLRIEKSNNSISTKQYYSQPTAEVHNNNSVQHTPEQSPRSQSNSWMFKRID
jgi:hypothetical protein